MTPKSSLLRKILLTLLVVTGTIGIILVSPVGLVLLRQFALEPFHCPSSYMAPGLIPGDRFYVNKFGIAKRELHRGDVIVYLQEFGTLGPPTHNIRRVVGLPGDVVSWENTELRVNGNSLPHRLVHDLYDADGNNWMGSGRVVYEEKLGDHVYHVMYNDIDRHAEQKKGELRVREGKLAILGDHRDLAYDSRTYGTIDRNLVIGVPWFIWFSSDPDRHTVRLNRVGKRIN